MTTDTAHRADGTSRAAGAGAWAVLLPAGRYDAERLVHHDTLELTGLDETVRPRPGDDVAVLIDDPLRLVALGRVAAPTGSRPEDPDDPQSDRESALVVRYTRRVFDEPLPVGPLTVDGPVTALDPAVHRALADRLGPPPPRRLAGQSRPADRGRLAGRGGAALLGVRAGAGPSGAARLRLALR